jgi:hypothetical protein
MYVLKHLRTESVLLAAICAVCCCQIVRTQTVKIPHYSIIIKQHTRFRLSVPLTQNQMPARRWPKDNASEMPRSRPSKESGRAPVVHLARALALLEEQDSVTALLHAMAVIGGAVCEGMSHGTSCCGVCVCL